MPKPQSKPNPADLIAIANPNLAKKLEADQNHNKEQAEMQKTAAHASFNQDIWKAVLVLNIMRYVVAMTLIMLTIIHLADNLPTIFETLNNRTLFIASIIVLVISAVAFTITTKFRLLPLSQILVAQFSIDLIITGLLTYSTGGLSSSFTWLFFIIVATGSVVLKRKQALGLASAAILIMLYEYIYTLLAAGTAAETMDFVIYSLVLMGLAILISALAQRLRNIDLQTYALGGESIEDYLLREEKTALKSALIATGGNKTEAAKLVGMTFRSFRYKVSKYEIS